ncbi:MAG: DUF484 family protein [Rhodanobacter sp.]
MPATLTDDAIDPSVVATYLRTHPEFLGDYPDVAAQLTVQRSDGSVASLAAYQLQNLRDQNVQLEQRLAGLIRIAAENESLMERVHALTLALLRASTLEVTARTVFARLSADFHSEQVRLLLFGRRPDLPRTNWLVQIPERIDALEEFAGFPEADEPASGRFSPTRLQRLFGDKATQIKSAAVMRLDDDGILAIGSEDPDRFQPGMGTLFLRMIAATVTAALARSRDVA